MTHTWQAQGVDAATMRAIRRLETDLGVRGHRELLEAVAAHRYGVTQAIERGSE